MASSWWPSYSKPASSSRSCKYDIFLSFRGEDTRKTFVDHLYTAFKERLISVYKDNETLPRGEYISLSLFEAIEESRIAVIIFSKNYANSSWCLEELVHIMKCKREIGLIVLPVFYDVDPSDVRNQKGDLGKSMSWKKLWNINKAQLWKKSLVDASNIAGWEVKHTANGHESQVIEEIIDTILDRLFPLNSDVDEDLVGMTTRLQDLKSKLNIGYDGVRMVGIWGCGGSGKTTLATSLYMEISHHFHGRCIVENVREESSKFDLKRLQENMLATIFKTEVKKDVKVGSVAEGKRKIKTMLSNRNVLLILDDVNELDQIKALAGSHNWFGSGSRIIITTRDEHLLTTHKVDVIFPVRLLSHDESIRLFKRHAYNEENPIEDYETLSLSVISYAAGLPLALKVLGSFLYDKENKGWMSTLARLKDIPEMEIMEKLKISYDGLKTVEKELFLEIVCFFRGWNKDEAMEILEACEFHPEIGIEVLRQKALITIVDGIFDMHALVQEMGYYIVKGEQPNNPEKHSRVWKDEAIKNMYFGDATMENDKIEAIYYDDYPSNHDHALHFCKIVSNMRKLRFLMVVMNIDMHSEGPSFLSNELKYIYWFGYPTRSSFPDNFHPTKLVVLKLEKSFQEKLWNGCKYLPHLKVLQLKLMRSLLSTPDFDGLPCLQKLIICDCYDLKEIHPSLGNHTSVEYVRVAHSFKLRTFPRIVHMKNLKTLDIEKCFWKDGEIFLSGIGELPNLQELNLIGNGFSRLDFNLSQLTGLKLLNLSDCVNLLELPELPSSLAILIANNCKSLTTVGDSHKTCKWLCQVSLRGGSIINDGDRLLQFMLEGKAIENHYMLLRLEGVEIAKGFTPPLLSYRRSRLKLPDNWCGDFCGFLICAVFRNKYIWDYSSSVGITMSRVMSDMEFQHHLFWEFSDIDFQDDIVSKESDNDVDKFTWVAFVSFGSLRHTTWWDQTHTTLSFSIQEYYDCTNFGVTLVDKKNRSGLTETSIDMSRYTPTFKIEHDSELDLMVSFK